MFDKNARNDQCRINPLEVPEPTECSWQGAATSYYIRSSVLGGETIAETGSSGQKMISYVRVGSSILAHLRTNRMWQQGGWVTSEAAYYENTDPSGTGFRVTPRLMPANWWDYSDQRKAEFDSGNSNVGLETNYQPVYEPGPSENLPLESESPLYVDGQKASVTIDGVSVSWLVARQMAEAGSTIPAGLASYQSLPGFQFTSNGLGNFSVTIPRQVGWNVTYGPNDGPNGTAHPVYRGSDAYSFTADWARSTPRVVGAAVRQDPLGTPPKGKKGLSQAKLDGEKLKDCLSQLFEVTTENFEAGKSFKGYFKEFGFLSSLLGPRNTIVETNTSYVSSGEIGYIKNGVFGTIGVISGYTPDDTWGTWWRGYNPQNNFVANNVGTANYQESIWVYELGNSMGWQTLKNPQAANQGDRYGYDTNDKGGPALTDCVYGGKVSTNGQITPAP